MRKHLSKMEERKLETFGNAYWEIRRRIEEHMITIRKKQINKRLDIFIDKVISDRGFCRLNLNDKIYRKIIRNQLKPIRARVKWLVLSTDWVAENINSILFKNNKEDFSRNNFEDFVVKQTKKTIKFFKANDPKKLSLFTIPTNSTATKQVPKNNPQKTSQNKVMMATTVSFPIIHVKNKSSSDFFSSENQQNMSIKGSFDYNINSDAKRFTPYSTASTFFRSPSRNGNKMPLSNFTQKMNISSRNTQGRSSQVKTNYKGILIFDKKDNKFI